MAVTIELTWHGPFKLQDFLNDETDEIKVLNSPGVYIWVEERNNLKSICYVGKASGAPNLVQRQKIHFGHQIGGRYTIPAAYMHNGAEWRPDQYPSNCDTVLNPDKFKQVIDAGFKYIENIEIYCAPLPKSEIIKLVERNLLYNLRPTGTIPGTKTPPGTELDITHKNAVWACPSVKEQCRKEVAES